MKKFHICEKIQILILLWTTFRSNAKDWIPWISLSHSRITRWNLLTPILSLHLFSPSFMHFRIMMPFSWFIFLSFYFPPLFPGNHPSFPRHVMKSASLAPSAISGDTAPSHVTSRGPASDWILRRECVLCWDCWIPWCSFRFIFKGSLNQYLI